jgi:hypothetical protein
MKLMLQKVMPLSKNFLTIIIYNTLINLNIDIIYIIININKF